MVSRRSNLAAQRGTAIIVALFVMSIVAAASVAMVMRLRIDIRRTELLLNADQAYLYAEGSLAWAEDLLLSNFKTQKPKQLVDHLPLTSKLDDKNGFRIQSTIEDAQQYFNINTISVKDNQSDFATLLKAVLATMEPNVISQLDNATRAWITSATNASITEKFYADQHPPYRSPHHLMTSQSELRLVQGMTPAIYAMLEPYLIALPSVVPININTASAPVLMSLNPNLSSEAAKSIVLYRAGQPFTAVDQFSNFAIIKNNPVVAAKITVTSNYFLVKTRVTVGEQTTILYTLLMRSPEQSKPAITVLWQTKGTL